MTIVTELPIWFTLFCIAAGALYAAVLYYRDKRMEEVSRWVRILLASFRFIVVTFICFLLLSPLLKTVSRRVEKPVLIIAQDNSESLVMNADSGYYRKEFAGALQKLAGSLGDKYDVRTYTFGDKVSEGLGMGFSDKQTDISALLSELETRYTNRNTGAIVIASDGLYNKGLNPVYASGKLKVPVYTIALGDTSVKKDAVVARVDHNKLAYLGNTFPMQVLVKASQLKGKSSLLTVSKGNATLFSQKIDFKETSFTASVPLQLEAKETGLQRYRVRIAELEGELNVRNNVQDVYIDVLDNRQKILLLADAPHPDIAAIKESLEGSQAYEVESALIDNFNQPLKQYSLIILHKLPNQRVSASAVMTEIDRSSIPVFSISGANVLQRGDLETSFNNKVNESEPVLAENFPLFTLSDKLRELIADMPAVTTPFGTYQAAPGDNVLLYQRIGIVNTKTPLLFFSSGADGSKVAVFTGEGLWRWKLHDYAVNKNQEAFSELLSKTVQYLSVKVDKSFFRVSMPKNNLFENEAVEFTAEVYNESYELVNDGEVTMDIVSSSGKRFPFTFNRTGNAYRLDAGAFPAGEYSYEATTRIGQKVYKERGEFSITALQLEAAATVADHQLLYQLAKKNRGEMVYPAELEKLAVLLGSNEEIKSVVYTEKKLDELINVKWLFFLLLALLSVEWFIRKRNGAY